MGCLGCVGCFLVADMAHVELEVDERKPLPPITKLGMEWMPMRPSVACAAAISSYPC
jgi:hypothetical protein